MDNFIHWMIQIKFVLHYTLHTQVSTTHPRLIDLTLYISKYLILIVQLYIITSAVHYLHHKHFRLSLDELSIPVVLH